MVFWAVFGGLRAAEAVMERETGGVIPGLTAAAFGNKGTGDVDPPGVLRRAAADVRRERSILSWS